MARDFESGSSEYLTRADPLITTISDFTVSIWFRLESTGSDMCMFCNGVDGAYGQGFALYYSSANGVRGLFPFVTWFASTSSLSTGTWYHALMTRSGSTSEVFVDGTSAGTTTSTPYTCDPNADTVIGARRRTDPGFDNYFDGMLAEAAMWNRALTTAERTALKNGLSPAYFPTNLLFYKPLFGGTEIEYKDSTAWSASGGATGNNHPRIIYPWTPPQFITPSVVATLEQEGFKWRDDNGSETTASWLNTQDSHITRAIETNTRLRVLINATGDPTSKQFQLEFREKSSGDPWTKITT